MTINTISSPKSLPPTPRRKAFGVLPNAIKRSDSDSSILLSFDDPLASLRRFSFPLSCLNDAPLHGPSTRQIRQIHQFIQAVAQRLHEPTPMTQHHIQAIVLIHCPPEGLLAVTSLNESTIELAKIAWQPIIDLAHYVNVSPNKRPQASLSSYFKRVASTFDPFITAFDAWKTGNIDHLTKLYIRLEADVRLSQNRPEIIYDHIGKGIRLVQTEIKSHLQCLDPTSGLLSLNMRLDAFNSRWPQIQWLHISHVERTRELCLTYAKTQQIIVPNLNWDHTEFQPWDQLSLTSPPSFNSLQPIFSYMLEALNDVLEDAAMRPIQSHFSDLSHMDDVNQTNCHSFIEHVISTLCESIHRDAPTIAFRAHLNQLIALKNTPDKALPFALKFILFYSECLSQFQLKKFLEQHPHILQERAIELERTFFKNTPLSMTHQWIGNYLSTTKDRHCYYPTFARHLLLKEILAISLTPPFKQKSELPDILRWDTTRLQRLHSNCQSAIETLVFFRSTDYFMRHASVQPLPNGWKDAVISLPSLSASISYIKHHTDLSQQSLQIYERMIHANRLPSSAVYQSTIKHTLPLLHHAIMSPSSTPPFHSLFPIQDFRVMLNYLWMVHMPLFHFHHQRFLMSSFMTLLDSTDLDIPTNTPFDAISKELPKFHHICHRISLAIAAMRVTRQFILSKFTFIHNDVAFSNLLNDIPHRLSPLLQPLFHSNTQPDAPFDQQLQLICQTYGKDLMSTHQSAMIGHLTRGLSQSAPPSLQDAAPILHELWAPFCHAHADLYSLPTAQQHDCLATFKLTKTLPPIHASFNQLNHELQRLYGQVPISLKFKSRQFKLPKRLCWNELMAYCYTIIRELTSTEPPTIPLDATIQFQIKTKLQSMMRKLNHHITNHPDIQLLPSHIRSGLK